MTAQRVVMVVDMQNGVFATPRLARERCVAQINRLVRAADKVIFIQHDEAGGLEAGSEGFALLPELEQPAGALYVTKTACDAFYHTSLAQVLENTTFSSSSSAAAPPTTASIPPLKMAPAAGTLLLSRKMPTPPPTAPPRRPRRLSPTTMRCGVR